MKSRLIACTMICLAALFHSHCALVSERTTDDVYSVGLLSTFAPSDKKQSNDILAVYDGTYGGSFQLIRLWSGRAKPVSGAEKGTE